MARPILSPAVVGLPPMTTSAGEPIGTRTVKQGTTTSASMSALTTRSGSRPSQTLTGNALLIKWSSEVTLRHRLANEPEWMRPSPIPLPTARNRARRCPGRGRVGANTVVAGIGVGLAYPCQREHPAHDQCLDDPLGKTRYHMSEGWPAGTWQEDPDVVERWLKC